MQSCCNLLAHVRFVTSSTRNFIASRFCTHFCALCAVFQSILVIPVQPFVPLPNKSPRAKLSASFLKDSSRVQELYCACGAATNSSRITPKRLSCPHGSTSCGVRSSRFKADVSSRNCREKFHIVSPSHLANRLITKLPIWQLCGRSCSSSANLVTVGDPAWTDISAKRACVA